MGESQPELVQGQKVWCPRCKEHVKAVRATQAAKIVEVDRRTIYNYIKRGRVQTFKVAGSTMRICSHCLLRDDSRLEVDDSAFTPDHREYLQEWANNLAVSIEVLLGRIVLAASEGELYAENAPADRPDGE